ncbi:MAG: radical SAM family heme chaperone HemW [Elusimicrobiota bacterium]
MTGLYVHIPFCHAKCRYCDFAAWAGRGREIPRYLAALETEIAGLGGGELETLFFGGGTPSVLEPEHWRSLLGAVRRAFRFAPGLEATVECNPESSSPEKFGALAELGVNRLSFGLQSAEDGVLKALGRLHDFARFRSVYLQARAAGFANVNVDLMFGLPGQTRAGWGDTLSRVLDLEPEHVSAYALTVEEETAFGRAGVRADGDLQADMYDEAADRLQAAGYVHYEISNFAKPGRECRHNLRYWKNLPCLGAGVSAASFDGRRRRANTDDLAAYMDAVERGESAAAEDEALTDEERLGEDLMLSLRLREGALPAPKTRALYGAALGRFQSLGFLEADPSGRVRPTRRGWLLSNRLFQELLSPAEPALVGKD